MAPILSRVALAAVLAAVCALPASAQGWKPKKSKIPDADIDRAIEKGIDWLKSNGGSGGGGPHGVTGEELVFYTLYHGGLPKNDPVFQSYLKRIVDKDPSKTYSVSVAAMCLSSLDKVGYQWKLEQYAQFLCDNQCANGQWSYGEPIRIEKKNITLTPSPEPPAQVASGPGGQMIKPAANDKTPLYGTEVRAGAAKGKGGGTQVLQKVKVRQQRKGPESGDNSNSQYASLGMRACGEAGIDIDPQVLRKALEWWEQQQCSDGGWSYGGKDAPGSWGSMTVGGTGALCIYNWLLGKKWQGDSKVQKSLQWVADNWALDKNPKAQEVLPDRAKFHYYYLYGLERAGMIYGTDFYGSHDWYDEGAMYLLKNQNPDGSWSGGEETTVWRTCFAILFLRRATKALPPKVYTGG
jgi:hypothetical protein